MIEKVVTRMSAVSKSFPKKFGDPLKLDHL